MTEISNNLIAALLVVFIILNMMQTAVRTTGINEKISGGVVGFAGACIAENASIEPISNQTAYALDPFFIDVNTTPDNANAFFYDTFPIFNISEEGYINFTANESQVGIYNGYLRINDSCGNFLDEFFMKFTIITSNHAPVLDFIPDQTIYQNEIFNYDVNATDQDVDPLTFGDNSTFFNIDPQTGEIQGVPQQQEVGNNSILIYVYDDKFVLDSQVVNFEVIDVNDAPVLGTIGAQTATINYTYYYDVNATDVDDTLPHILTFGTNSTLFIINSTTGVINFTAADGQNDTYIINVTVTDGELWDWEVIEFTVVYENHPPNITWWDPEDYELEMYEGEAITLSINAEDPDGTTPTAQWYLDGGLLTGATLYNYSYYAASGSRGYHNLTVVVSDGELTDWHEWEILVKRRDTQQSSSTGTTTSTPGPTKYACMENWRCDEWEPCRVDGYQIRKCRDLNKCGTTIFKPETTRNCTYHPQPSCEDGIQNCHHGGCEILVDCGGPCPPCPTCNDGIMNQGETGIDCGGPCPPCAEFQKPVKGEEKPKLKCGDGICGSGELFTCLEDCSGTLIEYIVVILVLLIIIILSYRYSETTMVNLMKFKRIFLVAVGKKTAPVMTSHERSGLYTLTELDKLNRILTTENCEEVFEKLSETMRKFFSATIHMKGEFTYIDLNESIVKLKMDDKTKKKISNFAIGMTKMEYGGYEVQMAEVANMLHLAISIVEGMTKTKTQKALQINKDIEVYDKTKKPEEAARVGEQETIKKSVFASIVEKFKKIGKSKEPQQLPAEQEKPKEMGQKRGPLFILEKVTKKPKEIQEPVPKEEPLSGESEKADEMQQMPEIVEVPEPAEPQLSFDECRSEINELLEEAERLCRMEDFERARDFYQQARELYDSVPKAERNDLVDETIRFIRVYNEIISSL